jgi:hypothetical protein
MEETKHLTRRDIIGRKIVAAYHEDLGVEDRFHHRNLVVRLDNGLLFNWDEIYDIKIDQPLIIKPRDFKETYIPMLSIEKDKDLDSPIKALITSEWFTVDVGVLLENGFVLTLGIAEYQSYYDFHRPSEKSRDYVELIIPES